MCELWIWSLPNYISKIFKFCANVFFSLVQDRLSLSYSFIHFWPPLHLHTGSRRCCSLSLLSWGEGGVSFWTSHKFITGPTQWDKHYQTDNVLAGRQQCKHCSIYSGSLMFNFPDWKLKLKPCFLRWDSVSLTTTFSFTFIKVVLSTRVCILNSFQ